MTKEELKAALYEQGWCKLVWSLYFEIEKLKKENEELKAAPRPASHSSNVASLIGWHDFSFHCKFVWRDNAQQKYICINDVSDTFEKECRVDICEMFKGAEEQ